MSKTHLRGFASMSKEKRKAIASMGGKEAHQRGTAHRFTSTEAKAASKRSYLRRGAASSK